MAVIAFTDNEPQHHPAHYVFMVSSAIADLARRKVRDDYEDRFKIHFWAYTELDQKVKKHPDILREFFNYQITPGSNKLIINICVLALTYGQHKNIPLVDLTELIDTHTNVYNVNQKGYVYGDSPDDWSPFEDYKSIVTYLSDQNYEIKSYSKYLSTMKDPISKNILNQEVDLFIIDPLFVTMGGDFNNLLNYLVGAIINSHKPFCIIIPNRLPAEMNKKVCHILDEKLVDLKLEYERTGNGEWKVDDPVRLRALLSRLYQQMKNRPIKENLQIVDLLFNFLGARSIHHLEVPRISG
jgi:hypothetical protein